PAAASLKTVLAVIQTTGVIARHVVTHQASRSLNCNRMIRHHAATRSAPPRAETKCRDNCGLAPKSFVPIQPKNMYNGYPGGCGWCSDTLNSRTPIAKFTESISSSPGERERKSSPSVTQKIIVVLCHPILRGLCI